MKLLALLLLSQSTHFQWNESVYRCAQNDALEATLDHVDGGALTDNQVVVCRCRGRTADGGVRSYQCIRERAR